jgi:RNA-directed DNA polymerase
MTRAARFRRLVAQGLAAAFLDGPWSPSAMAERGAAAIGRSSQWLGAMATRTHAAFPMMPSDRFGELATAIESDSGLEKALWDRRHPVRVRRFFSPSPTMGLARADFGVPSMPTIGDIATWLNEDIAHLTWLADWRGLARHTRDPRLRHYVYRWMPKRSGGVRLLEAPKPTLKAIQRRILREILDRVPPHEAAHGFRSGRGVLTHAHAHAGKNAVLRMDLEDFFPSIPAGRVYGVFRTLGYPEEAARVLTGLCTSRAPTEGPEPPCPATPLALADLYRARQRYRTRHLPQGAPTSPSLANLCAFGLDVRLAAAARHVGATYSRYADDLVFSGDEAFARTAPRFATLVATIAFEEGFQVQHRKTRVMRYAQRQVVTGLVVNQRPAIRRDEYDRLRAVLHNCARLGPESQNRDGHPDFRAHLEGAVAWVCHVQPDRGAKLEAALRRIQWPVR